MKDLSLGPVQFRAIYCPGCPLYKTCPQFAEQVNACLDALVIQQEEEETEKQPLPLLEEE